MGLILCNGGSSAEGYLARSPGVRFHTLEELCWWVNAYPELFLRNDPDEALCSFVGETLGEKSIALQLLNLRDNDKDGGLFCIRLLELSGLYSGEELNSFRERVRDILSEPEDVFLRKKADLFTTLGRYGRALKIYEDLLSRTEKSDAKKRAELLGCRGAASANLFRFAEAEECYAEALRTAPEEQYLRQLYFLFRLEEDKDHAGQIAGTADPDLVRKWDGEFEEGIKAAGESGEVRASVEAFYGDPVQRERKAAALTAGLKKRYREILRECQS